MRQPLELTPRAPLGDPAAALHDARPEASSTLTAIAHVLNRLLGVPGNASDKGRHNATTVAVLTRASLSACEPSVPCNTCGAGFQILLYLHFAWDMFSASCPYMHMLSMTQSRLNHVFISSSGGGDHRSSSRAF